MNIFQAGLEKEMCLETNEGIMWLAKYVFLTAHSNMENELQMNVWIHWIHGAMQSGLKHTYHPFLLNPHLD